MTGFVVFLKVCIYIYIYIYILLYPPRHFYQSELKITLIYIKDPNANPKLEIDYGSINRFKITEGYILALTKTL